MQAVVVCGRTIRDKTNNPIKLPLKELVVIHPNASTLKNLEALKAYLAEEVNVREVKLTDQEGDFVTVFAELNFKTMGKKLGADLPSIQVRTILSSPLSLFAYLN